MTPYYGEVGNKVGFNGFSVFSWVLMVFSGNKMKFLVPDPLAIFQGIGHAGGVLIASTWSRCCTFTSDLGAIRVCCVKFW